MHNVVVFYLYIHPFDALCRFVATVMFWLQFFFDWKFLFDVVKHEGLIKIFFKVHLNWFYLPGGFLITLAPLVQNFYYAKTIKLEGIKDITWGLRTVIFFLRLSNANEGFD